MNMIVLIYGMVLQFFVVAVQAQDLAAVKGLRLTAQWTACTERTDDTKLSAAEIKGYTVVWTCDASGDDSLFTKNTSVVLPDTLLGQCYLSVFCEDVNGIRSEMSDPFHLFVKLNKPTRGGFR